MPKAQWIVSISDNGWFGHSLASYQQLQMAQLLSLLTGRYQVVVNNDGLSSIIDTHGNIVESLLHLALDYYKVQFILPKVLLPGLFGMSILRYFLLIIYNFYTFYSTSSLIPAIIYCWQAQEELSLAI